MSKSIQKLTVLLLALLLIVGMIPVSVSAASNPSVTYRTHVQNEGWQDWKKDGAMSGISGKGFRLEGIEAKLDTQGYDLGINYQTHIQNIGWEADTERGWKSNGSMSGTEGLSYRLEAIQIKLTGIDAEKFDIYYRVHAQNVGWMGWAKNGDSAGTAGYGYRLEGIEIQIVASGSGASGSTEDVFRDIKEQNYKSIYKNILKYAYDDSACQYYSIFDIDNNGIPELLLCSGTNSIDIMTYVYTCENKAYKYLGEFHIGHTAFYGQNSRTSGQLIGSWYHQGNHHVFNINLVNGQIIKTTISSGFTDTMFKTDYPIPKGDIDDFSLLNSFVN